MDQRERPGISEAAGEEQKKDKNSGGNDDNYKHKKFMHRQVEQLRRQEMSKLYGSLRSLLPLEFIKGKRSTSDHMHQAVIYIDHLQRNLKKLEMKRNELSTKNVIINPGNTGISSNSNNNIVTVSPSFCGVEIVISTGPLEEGISLSKVMQVLHEERLCVISCASTRVNEGYSCIIQCEADLSSINISAVQQKLNDVIGG